MKKQYSAWRLLALFTLITIIISLMATRLLYLGNSRHEALSERANQVTHANHILPAHRGVIYDRHGIPLAVSAPVFEAIINPKLFHQAVKGQENLAALSALGLNPDTIREKLDQDPTRQYLVLKRNITPPLANRIREARIPGLTMQAQHRTFFPTGKVAAQIVGFTDRDNRGQSGIELAYDRKLQEHPGEESVVQSAVGQILAIQQQMAPPKDGQDITLSVDARIQYMVYEALRDAVEHNHAKSAEAVVLVPKTGEVLAAVSYPSFNPNDVSARVGEHVKDRAITDLFEPGSVIKPIALAAALDKGVVTPETLIQTHGGLMVMGRNRIKDEHPADQMTVRDVIKYSSNIGISNIALQLDHQDLVDIYHRMGLDEHPSQVFPGESSGYVPSVRHMNDFSYATLSFGYGFSTSLVALARAYGAIANDGVLLPVSYVKQDTAPSGRRVVSSQTAKVVRGLLKDTADPDGSGRFAEVPGYVVGGKTGTAKIAVRGGYSRRFNASFAGIAPIDHPELVVVIRIHEPTSPRLSRYGALSAAPVFSRIVGGALRVMGMRPDEHTVDVEKFNRLDKRRQQLESV